MTVLTGIRVVEASVGVACRFAGMTLADWGADVVRIIASDDRPDAEVADSEVVEPWDRGKSIISCSRKRLETLIAEADVFIYEHGSIDIDAIWLTSAISKGLRAVTFDHPVTGRSGRAETDASQAVVGLMYTHVAANDPERPVYHVAPAASYGAGYLVLLGALAALCTNVQSGGLVLRTSELEGALAMIRYSVALPVGASTGGVIPNDGDPFRITSPLLRFYQTADDEWILIAVPTAAFWVKLCKAFNRQDWLLDARFEGAPFGIATAEYRWALISQIADTVRAHSSADALKLLSDAQILVGPVHSHEQFMASDLAQLGGCIEHIDWRGRDVEQVASSVSFGDDSVVRRAPSLVSEHNFARHSAPRWQSQQGGAWPSPLAGRVVLDYASFVAAPQATKYLADLGATVIKVEPPGGDPLRQVGYSYSAVNTGKRQISLDLLSPDGRAESDRLIASADVIVHNFRPSLQRLTGVSEEAIHRLNPYTIVCGVDAYSGHGAYAERRAVDGIFQAATGACLAQGGGIEPRGFYGGIVDNATALSTACSAIAALIYRETTQNVATVHTSLLRVAAAVQTHALIRGSGIRTGVRSLGADAVGRGQLARLYQARDGWLYIDATTETARLNLANLLEIAEPSAFTDDEDPQTTLAGPIATALAAYCAPRSADELMRELQAIDVAATKVNKIANLADVPVIRDRSLLQIVEHSEWGPLWHAAELLHIDSP